MNGHRGIAEHGLRPGRGKPDEFLRVLDRITKGPKASFDGLMVSLVIGHGGLQLGVPVDQPLAAKNQAVAKEIEKGLPNRAGADRVEGEACALPIAATTQLAQLAQNPRLV